MLYEAMTYKDIDDFNQQAAARYADFHAMYPQGPSSRFWKVLHLNVNKNGSIFVLWCREMIAKQAD